MRGWSFRLGEIYFPNNEFFCSVTKVVCWTQLALWSCSYDKLLVIYGKRLNRLMYEKVLMGNLQCTLGIRKRCELSNEHWKCWWTEWKCAHVYSWINLAFCVSKNHRTKKILICYLNCASLKVMKRPLRLHSSLNPRLTHDIPYFTFCTYFITFIEKVSTLKQYKLSSPCAIIPSPSSAVQNSALLLSVMVPVQEILN